MSRKLIGLSIVVVGVLSAACGGQAPASSAGAGGGATSTSGPALTTTAVASAPAIEGGLSENDLSVEQLCAALTAEELTAILGEPATIDPAETVWCGYDLEDGSGMFVAGNNDTAEEFLDQVRGAGCDAKTVAGNAVLSSCGQDKEAGRPTEAWFLLDGVGVQLSVDTDATEADYLEMIREALD